VAEQMIVLALGERCVLQFLDAAMQHSVAVVQAGQNQTAGQCQSQFGSRRVQRVVCVKAAALEQLC